LDAPGYLVGEKDSADSRVVLKPRETKTFDIRLNWPGTGSIPAERLIDEGKPGKYSIKFLLFFRVNGVDEYVESQPTEIQVGNNRSAAALEEERGISGSVDPCVHSLPVHFPRLAVVFRKGLLETPRVRRDL